MKFKQIFAIMVFMACFCCVRANKPRYNINSIRQPKVNFDEPNPHLFFKMFRYTHNNYPVIQHQKSNENLPERCQDPRKITTLNEKVLCPFDIVETYNENIFPHFQSEAQCRCKKCLNLSDKVVVSFGCKPLTELRKVLSRENKTAHWLPYNLEVPVACVCQIREKKLQIWNRVRKIRIVT